LKGSTGEQVPQKTAEEVVTTSSFGAMLSWRVSPGTAGCARFLDIILEGSWPEAAGSSRSDRKQIFMMEQTLSGWRKPKLCAFKKRKKEGCANSASAWMPVAECSRQQQVSKRH
jgi:hypothetical protein